VLFRSPPGRNYVWGVETQNAWPGNIIQFWDTHFTSPDGFSSWGTAKGGQHTALIAGHEGPVVSLIHQNDGVRKVTFRALDLRWKLAPGGKYIIYSPYGVR